MAIGFFIFGIGHRKVDISYMDIGDLIAKNLAEIIEAKGANPSAVAKAASLGHTYVRDIILRKTKSPTYTNLVKIADVLGVDVTEITVGPVTEGISSGQREMLDLWSQLPEQLRQNLLGYGKGLLEVSDSTPLKSYEEPQ